jgi:archaemetzincin
MNIGIVQIGKANISVVSRVQENLETMFPDKKFTLISETFPLPKEAYSKSRKQYRSDIILNVVHELAETNVSLDRMLGVTDVDLFVPRLNFVFGEAENLGKVAVVSVYRLRPEFYKRPANDDVLVERATKEVVHELGHTFGLRHCANPFCVMYFSRSIFETDRKHTLFCGKCYQKIANSFQGNNVEK